MRTGFEHRRNGSGVQRLGGAGKFHQFVGERIQRPVNIELVLCGTVLSNVGLRGGGARSGGGKWHVHTGGIQVLADGAAVAVGAVVPHELGGVA